LRPSPPGAVMRTNSTLSALWMPGCGGSGIFRRALVDIFGSRSNVYILRIP